MAHTQHTARRRPPPAAGLIRTRTRTLRALPATARAVAAAVPVQLSWQPQRERRRQHLLSQYPLSTLALYNIYVNSAQPVACWMLDVSNDCLIRQRDCWRLLLPLPRFFFFGLRKSNDAAILSFHPLVGCVIENVTFARHPPAFAHRSHLSLSPGTEVHVKNAAPHSCHRNPLAASAPNAALVWH